MWMQKGAREQVLCCQAQLNHNLTTLQGAGEQWGLVPWLKHTSYMRSFTDPCTGPIWGRSQPWASPVSYLLCALKLH